MASVFTAAQSGDLTHVDFWTTSNNAQYEIYVWDGFFGTTELAHQTGSCLEYGYYSIPLSTPISIGAGQQFTVGIIMTTPGYNYPIPFEKEILGTVEPPIQSDVSFMRYSEGYTWTDLAEYGWNACLRARMVSEVPENNPPDMPTDPSPADEATGIGINPTLSVVVSDLDVDSMDVTFYDANGDSVIGTDMNVPSGSAASVTWSELNYATTYSWYAIADDGIDSTQSTIWSFTTGDAPNQPPNAPINPLPSDGATGIVLNPALRVDVIDPDGDSMDVTFYEGSDDSVIGTVTDIPSGGTATTTWSGLAYETTYSWYAIADDNIAGTTQSSTWSFTTETAPNNPPDTPSNPNPADGATGVDLSPTLSVSVNDADGDTMTVYFYDGSSVLLGTDTVSGSGTATATWTNADQYSTIYYWYTVADDRKDQTTSPTWQFTTKDKPQEIVEFSDSFEVSEWNGLWVEEDSQNDWFRSTQRATDGSRSAEVDGRATDATLTMADPIDLSGKSTATLTFSWFIEASWDSGEYIALDVHDGTWQEIKRLSGNVDEENVWHHETIDLTPYMVKNFQIRFRAKVSSSREDGNVDNVKIVSVGGQPNNPPDTPSNPVPVNGATDIGLSPTLSVDVSDPDGDSMDVAFYDEFGVLIGTDTGVSSGTRASAEWSGLSYDTTYGWYAVADDGKDTTQSATTWHFTTESTPQEIVEFSDSFEVSEWNGLWVENSQNDWFRSTQRKNDGSYSAEVDGGATDATLTMADSIDLSGKSTATLTFSWFIESSWDAGEYISLDMFYNNAWHNGVASINGAWRTGLEENRWISVSISNMDATYLGDTMPSDFKIRFRAKVSSSIEDGNVDNVTIITSVK
jgi:hypothetical protein